MPSPLTLFLPLLVLLPAAAPQQPAPAPLPPIPAAVFEKPIPPDQLTPLSQFAGAPAKTLLHDKQFHKLLRSIIPDCTFHYGRDMSLADVLDMVLSGSKNPVEIRDGRYLILSGQSGPYLAGRGFLWLDLQQGIGLGAFFFHPTNGEPTPTIAVFSREVRDQTLTLTQLPPAFAQDLAQWSHTSRIPFLTTRYFITGANKRILLEHDEDLCDPGDGSSPPPSNLCQQIEADAADIDETAAYYLDQIHYAPNGTAWMIGPDQLSWVQLRENTCGIGPDRLACRIRLTREHTHRIVGTRPIPHPPHR